MKNILSPEVKTYFIHALKGIGIGANDEQNKFHEFSEQEICTYLDGEEVTPLDIFNKIKEAATQQLEKDKQGDQRLQKTTSFSHKTVSNAFADNEFTDQGCPNLQKEEYEQYLHNLCDFKNEENSSIVAQTMIKTLKAGLIDQKALKSDKNLRQEAENFWNILSDSQYENWKEQQTDPVNQELTKEEFYNELPYNNLLTKTNQVFGNPDLAKNFLNSKFNPEAQNFLKVDDKLLKLAEQNCLARGVEKAEVRKNLTVQDVLLAVSKDQNVEQVITYFQTRSQEQDKMGKDKTDKVTTDNKIGNLMGKKGRKMIDRAAVTFNKGKGKKKGKTIWRGYKEIYDKILSFMGNIYSNVMTMSFVENIMKREGLLITDAENTTANYEVSKANDKPWEIVENTPTEFQEKQGTDAEAEKESVAKKFYDKTKSRILADKMRMYKLQTALENADLRDEKVQEFQDQVKYLQERIATGEQVLSNEIPDSNSDLFQDASFFNKLEAKILNAKQYEDNANVKKLIDADKGRTANQEMNDALRNFGFVATRGKMTPSRLQAKRLMAQELLGVGGLVEANEISIQDLDQLTDRFIDNHLEGLKKQVTKTEVDPATGARKPSMTVAQASNSIKDFVKNDLMKNALKEKYDQFMVTKNREQIIQESTRELG